MAIPRNPRVFARDIADGYVIFNRATCRQFSHADIRTIYRNLEVVVREIRADQVPLENIPAVQHRNQRLQRANTTMMFIRNYARRYRFTL